MLPHLIRHSKHNGIVDKNGSHAQASFQAKRELGMISEALGDARKVVLDQSWHSRANRTDSLSVTISKNIDQNQT